MVIRLERVVEYFFGFVGAAIGAYNVSVDQFGIKQTLIASGIGLAVYVLFLFIPLPDKLAPAHNALVWLGAAFACGAGGRGCELPESLCGDAGWLPHAVRGGQHDRLDFQGDHQALKG